MVTEIFNDHYDENDFDMVDDVFYTIVNDHYLKSIVMKYIDHHTTRNINSQLLYKKYSLNKW